MLDDVKRAATAFDAAALALATVRGHAALLWTVATGWDDAGAKPDVATDALRHLAEMLDAAAVDAADQCELAGSDDAASRMADASGLCGLLIAAAGNAAAIPQGSLMTLAETLAAAASAAEADLACACDPEAPHSAATVHEGPGDAADGAADPERCNAVASVGGAAALAR